MLIYFDSMVLIYLLDAVGPWKGRAAARIASMSAAGGTIALSDLTRLECRVQPLRLNATKTLTDMDVFFRRTDVHFLPISSAVFDRATTIRAAFNFKLADSLHLAAAVEAGCDRFLTNDARLSAFSDIAIELLPP